MKTKMLVQAVALLATTSFSLQAQTLFSRGSDWKYFIGTSEASSPIDAWRSPLFNDASWSSGPAPLGYGEPDINTQFPSSGSVNYLSGYFRKTFVINDPSTINQMDLNLWIDDGVVAWINGREVVRNNVAAGDVLYTTAALSAVEPLQVSTSLNNNLGSLLVSGNNILAVQVLNANITSADLYMDASLDVTSVPEPGSLLLFSLAGLALALHHRLRR